jgi:hypothetical protein
VTGKKQLAKAVLEARPSAGDGLEAAGRKILPAGDRHCHSVQYLHWTKN